MIFTDLQKVYHRVPKLCYSVFYGRHEHFSHYWRDMYDNTVRYIVKNLGLYQDQFCMPIYYTNHI